MGRRRDKAVSAHRDNLLEINPISAQQEHKIQLPVLDQLSVKYWRDAALSGLMGKWSWITKNSYYYINNPHWVILHMIYGLDLIQITQMHSYFSLFARDWCWAPIKPKSSRPEEIIQVWYDMGDRPKSAQRYTGSNLGAETGPGLNLTHIKFTTLSKVASKCGLVKPLDPICPKSTKPKPDLTWKSVLGLNRDCRPD